MHSLNSVIIDSVGFLGTLCNMLFVADADVDAVDAVDADDTDVDAWSDADAVTPINSTRSYTRRIVPSSLGWSLFCSI